MKKVSFLQGWGCWLLALVAVLALPGATWRAARPEPFPFHALFPSILAVLILGVSAPALTCLLGPAVCRNRFLALWETIPDLLWGALVLALWPARWGPPALAGWMVAFLLSGLSSEVRWLSQSLPAEEPFPRAWGPRAVRRVRRLSLLRLIPRWMAVRAPFWITATIVLEQMLAVPGLGTDWMTRVVQRDRAGIAVWLAGFALLWALTRREQRGLA